MFHFASQIWNRFGESAERRNSAKPDDANAPPPLVKTEKLTHLELPPAIQERSNSLNSIHGSAEVPTKRIPVSKLAFDFWKKPDISPDIDEHKRATWGELFYDVVYILALERMSSYLVEHDTAHGFYVTLGLLIPIFWTWLAATIYWDRFETPDLFHRVYLFLQICLIAFLVINIEDIEENAGARGFAASYAATRLLLILLYLRIYLLLPEVRRVSLVYIVGYTVSGAIFLASAFVPHDHAIPYYLWIGAMCVEIPLPFVNGESAKLAPLHPNHIPERIGLFVIIALGENVAGAVQTVFAATNWRAYVGVGLGVAFSFSCWWLYFNEAGYTVGRRIGLTTHAMRRRSVHWKIWLAAHVPLIIFLSIAGTGVELLLLDFTEPEKHHYKFSDRWIFSVSVSIYFISLAVVHLMHENLDRKRKVLKAFLRVVVALVGLAIGMSVPWPSWTLLLWFTCLNIAQILFDLFFQEYWIIQRTEYTETGKWERTPRVSMARDTKSSAIDRSSRSNVPDLERDTFSAPSLLRVPSTSTNNRFKPTRRTARDSELQDKSVRSTSVSRKSPVEEAEELKSGLDFPEWEGPGSPPAELSEAISAATSPTRKDPTSENARTTTATVVSSKHEKRSYEERDREDADDENDQEEETDQVDDRHQQSEVLDV